MDEGREQAETRLGTVLRGKYHLDRVLGVGGMAAVYAATHRNAKQFAVKMLHQDLSRNADTRARFLREGYAANSVNHPGAVAVIDDDTTEDGAAFLVMELLEGTPIDTLYEARKKLGAAEVIAIGWELLDVLAAAHEKAIVHRDIKPANLFLTKDGHIKVLDFGIARVRDFATNAAMTVTGAVVGTPAFMPPEQATGEAEKIDGLTDQWAVGATLFTLLTGHYVHEGGTSQLLMIRAATTPARSVSTFADVAEVPPPLAHVIDRALSFQREGRWPSARDMRVALEQAHLQIYGRPVSPLNLAALAGQKIDGYTLGHGPGTAHIALPMMRAPAQSAHRDGTLPAVATTSIAGVPRRGSLGPWLVVSALAIMCVIAVALFIRKTQIEKDGPHAVALPDATSTLGTTTTSASSPVSVDGPSNSASVTTALPPPTSSADSFVAPSPPSSSSKNSARPKSGLGTGNANPAKTPAKDCNPNYTLDADGNKHFKPECF